VTLGGRAGYREGAVGRPTKQEQAGSLSTCGAEQSRFLVSFFPYQPVQRKRRTHTSVIKYERAHSKGLLGWYAGPRRCILTNRCPSRSISVSNSILFIVIKIKYITQLSINIF
jgi:hypothetical protein